MRKDLPAEQLEESSIGVKTCPYCLGDCIIAVRTGLDCNVETTCSACHGDGFFEPWETIPTELPPLGGSV